MADEHVTQQDTITTTHTEQVPGVTQQAPVQVQIQPGMPGAVQVPPQPPIQEGSAPLTTSTTTVTPAPQTQHPTP